MGGPLGVSTPTIIRAFPKIKINSLLLKVKRKSEDQWIPAAITKRRELLHEGAQFG